MTRKHCFFSFIWIIIIILMSSTVAKANPQSLFLGGTQLGAYSNYSYLGWIQPLPGSRLGQGWFASGFVNYLTYQYNSGSPSQTVKTKAPGFSIGLGYAETLNFLHWEISGALGYANFDVQPSVVPNAAKPTPQGSTWTFTPQFQWSYAISKYLEVMGIDNYSFGQKSYWSDWRVQWHVKPKFSIGPEAILQGGQNYQIHQVGLFVGTGPFDGWQLGISGGVSFQPGQKNSGYVGLSFSKTL